MSAWLPDNEGTKQAFCRRLATVDRIQRLGSLTWLVLYVPGWPGARPGQFVMLQSQDSRCFLARPFSVADQTGERVSFLIAPVGEASRELCGHRRGERVWVLGPLGNGFDLEAITADARRVVLVGGGVGIAPFPLVLRCLNALHMGGRLGVETLVLLGFRNAAQSQAVQVVQAILEQTTQEGLVSRLEVTREDDPSCPGSMVSDLARAHIRSGDRLLGCGPFAMSRTLWQICQRVPDVKAWFSLETVMACGLGACHGCVITKADGSLSRVCREGPVFRGEEVFGD
ncbi:MAG: hypothetical protein N3B14_06235 [Thermoleophilia bacterium]|nr:hypothetical protein [Thermoleophilia bacterium]